MKTLVFIILSTSISFAFSSTETTATKESIALIKGIASSDLGKEWGTKLASRFAQIAKISQKFGKYAGPAGEIISFALSIVEDQLDTTEQYLMDIVKQLDKIEAKLDDISDQITFLDKKVSQSTKRLIAEGKLRDFETYSRSLSKFKENYESIIAGFVSNSSLLIIELDQYIRDYRKMGSDTELVDTLDSTSRFSTSLVDDLIYLSRSYRKENFGSSGSSTMKLLYDIYITTFVKVIKANLILESAVNLKTAITGDYFEEDRRTNHFRKDKILEKFFESFKKSFQKLNLDDTNEFLNFEVNGGHNNVRMINVLQYFWENEDHLSSINTCTDTCDHFQNRGYNGGGCYGSVRNCDFGVSLHHTERYLRQSPQVDRIYDGYVLNYKWYGYGIDDDSNPNMESKKSYLRGFVNCHVCKCICDQHSHDNTIRQIYTGKLSAPEGYVVTGVKFIERYRIIYPQIQVGKLLPMATVDQNSVRWLDVPYSLDNFAFYYDTRGLEFGDPSIMNFPDGVVTGVQFQRIPTGVSWSIYGRDLVDFNKGIMGSTEKIILTPDTYDELNANDLIPGVSSSSKKFTIQKHTKVQFGVSNDEKDAGQSFVPYFDGNEVSFEIKSPLSGLTLIHYTNDKKYAGYIRPFLRSMDYRRFFSTSYKIEEFVPINYSDGRV